MRNVLGRSNYPSKIAYLRTAGLIVKQTAAQIPVTVFALSRGKRRRIGSQMYSSNGEKSFDESDANSAEFLHDQVDAIFDHAPFILYCTSIENGSRGRLTRVSSALLQIVGISPDDAVKEDWWIKSIHPEDLRQTLEIFADLADGQRVTHVYRLRTAVGGYASVSDTLVVRERKDKFYGFGFVSDLSSVNELKSQKLLIGRLANLGELATSLAHELVQPLNTIKVAAYNIRTKLEMGDANIASHEARLDRITRQVDRAANLISHLKIFGQDSDKQKAPFMIEDAINGALELVENHFLQLGIKTFVKIPRDLPSLFGYQILLEQVFLNLFLNVRDVVNARRIKSEVVVHIEVVEAAKFVEVRVLDNVGGIPEHILPRIFEPFVTTKPAGQPGGLGLPISFGIVKDMGGTIEADNVGDGACFTIRLPVVSTSL